MHKLTTELAGSFPNAEHRFERLEKREDVQWEPCTQ
jgi:hypothetical protein